MSVLPLDSIEARNIRHQVALVRALADQVERSLPSARSCMSVEQLGEELVKLGCQLIDAAARMGPPSAAPPAPTSSSDDHSAVA